MENKENSVGELVRKAESVFLTGSTQISKYVSHSLHDTLERIEAYHNSKHLSGETDSLGRDKPFFNISIAVSNIWFRATDIDRNDIKVTATKTSDWLNSFLATIILQDWMKRERFGAFLNEWGRSLAKYGSSIVKFVDDSISVTPWGRMIVDAVDFENNLQIEILELTESELRKRIKTNGYNAQAVKDLIGAETTRQTLDKNTKDNKSGYYKLYEVHGELPLSLLTDNDEDKDEYQQQMHIISFVGTKSGRKIEYQDFTLYRGREKESPYMLTHLIKEDNRTLSIGSIERMFEAQWMNNHSIKQIKDSLDLASKIVFQTADSRFIGQNVLDAVETGTILIHTPNLPLTSLNNQAHDIVNWQNFSAQFKAIGNEAASISEAMLGVAPKAGTAWRQTEAMLTESHSLFELMTENKGLALDEMLRTRIIPRLKRKLNHGKEIMAVLKSYQIEKIDGIYVKNEAIKRTNKHLTSKIIAGQMIAPDEQAMMTAQNEIGIKESLSILGNQRGFTPAEIDWATQLKDIEWELDIDITGEQKNVREIMTTLNTALQMIMNPGFEQNKKAQAVVGKIFELTGAMSPIEYNALPSNPPMNPLVDGGGGGLKEKLPELANQ